MEQQELYIQPLQPDWETAQYKQKHTQQIKNDCPYKQALQANQNDQSNNYTQRKFPNKYSSYLRLSFSAKTLRQTQSKSYNNTICEQEFYDPDLNTRKQNVIPFKSNVANYKRSQSAVFGTTRRKLHNVSQNPGVSTYDVSDKSRQVFGFKAPSATFGKAQKRFCLSEDRSIPGPADYTLKRSIQAHNGVGFPKAQWNETEKSMFGFKNVIPGPQSYKCEKETIQSARCTIGRGGRETSQEFIRKNNNPGPSDYKPNIDPKKQRNPTVIIGRDRRIASLINYGSNKQYNIPETWNQGPKVGFTKQIKMNVFSSPKKQPGPADYSPNIQSVKKESQQIKIPNSKRQAELQALNSRLYCPGVASYHIENKNEKSYPKYTIGKGKREHELAKGNEGPGVGQYEMPYQFQFKYLLKYKVNRKKKE